ncbi:hypothetical protein GGP41_006508 [Bipolaris sorokiniana]|uniref:Uncharacterized protein n=1 Tax=Cochliobolus sativus TaxID=45130 RepID=A0A8H5ZN65_COCSA|nr:hypothetical protein GGP41_006508 [Bipolaris sorokiniana]
MFRSLMNMLRAYREKAKQTNDTDVISPKNFPTLSTKKHLKSAKSSREGMGTGMRSKSSSQPTNNTSTTNPSENFSFTPESSHPSNEADQASTCSPRARSPSPCPFSPLPPSEQTEPFPTYKEDEKEWDEWNEWNEDIRTVPYRLDHCTQHCRRPICRSVTRGKERRNVDQGACLCSLEPPPATDSISQVQIQQFSEEDIAVVQATYNRTNKQDFITVNLATAITLVDLLRQTYYLNLCSRLQWDPDFTSNVLLHSDQYYAATQSTNELVDKLFVHLMLLLAPMPNQTRYIEVQELEQTMQSVMRLEFFWWQSQWCFKQQGRIPREDDLHVRMMKDGFVRARRRYISGKQSMGVQVMMEKLEDIVEMAVSVLVWWSEYTSQLAVEIEEAESIGLDSSVASFVSAQSYIASDESDADGRDREKV